MLWKNKTVCTQYTTPGGGAAIFLREYACLLYTSYGALYAEAEAVLLEDGFGDGKPQTGALLARIGAGAVIPVKDLSLIHILPGAGPFSTGLCSPLGWG